MCNYLQVKFTRQSRPASKYCTVPSQSAFSFNSGFNDLPIGRVTATFPVRPPRELEEKVHFQQSQRALDVMRCALPEQRRCSRVHLPIRAIAVFPDLNREPYTALMRDMNMLGAFFYCMKKPDVGNKIKLHFSLPEQGEKTKITCEGIVVRVEESAEGAAIGIAIQFTRYQLSKPPKPEQPRSFVRDRLSFIGWTVELVERMFERTAGLRERMADFENAA